MKEQIRIGLKSLIPVCSRDLGDWSRILVERLKVQEELMLFRILVEANLVLGVVLEK
jgi:hypothetical protein